MAKLRPLFVSFTGDMINKDVDEEWTEWFDDWRKRSAAMAGSICSCLTAATMSPAETDNL